jgi:hypothetical protein
LHHQPITHPGELVALSPDELFGRVKQLLRYGGLLSNYERLKRIKPNIYSACFELGEEWRKSPRLGGREVPFSEYLAARLGIKLLRLDREQNPHLYDPHGKYRPDGHTLPLEYELGSGAESWIPLPAASYPSLSEVASWPQELQKAGNYIAQPSLSALVELMTDIARGGKSSPYRTARRLGPGLSPTEAHCRPATAAHLEIIDYLAGYSAMAAATSPR